MTLAKNDFRIDRQGGDIIINDMVVQIDLEKETNLNQDKNETFDQCVMKLGIENLGAKTMKFLGSQYMDDDIVDSLNLERMTYIKDVNEKNIETCGYPNTITGFTKQVSYGLVKKYLEKRRESNLQFDTIFKSTDKPRLTLKIADFTKKEEVYADLIYNVIQLQFMII